MKRRDFIKTASIISISGVVSPATFSKENEKTSGINLSIIKDSRNYEHKVKNLSFNPKKLEGISEKVIVSHWKNNYAGSVKALNATRKRIFEALQDKSVPPYIYNDLKRETLARLGSVINHELYFDNLGGNGKAGGPIKKAISKAFGSFDIWEKDFKNVAKGLSGGSGWVIFGYNQHLDLMENYWAPDHLHSGVGISPLLVLDMYEHSYHMDHGTQAEKYIDAFFRNINWDEVNKRFEAALS